MVRGTVDQSPVLYHEEDKMKNKFKLKEIPARLKNRFGILRKKIDESKYRSVLVWIFQIAVVLVFAAMTSLFFFRTVTMQESAMEPTYQVGQNFFLNRVAYTFGSPKRGDLIVFKTNASDEAALHIRRVIGLPGETIQIKDGQIYIHGELYKESRDLDLIENTGLAQDGVTLQSGEYFVLGDNRNNSEDSRYADIGNVKKRYIVGKLWFVSSPLREIGFVKD